VANGANPAAMPRDISGPGVIASIETSVQIKFGSGNGRSRIDSSSKVIPVCVVQESIQDGVGNRRFNAKTCLLTMTHCLKRYCEATMS